MRSGTRKSWGSMLCYCQRCCERRLDRARPFALAGRRSTKELFIADKRSHTEFHRWFKIRNSEMNNRGAAWAGGARPLVEFAQPSEPTDYSSFNIFFWICSGILSTIYSFIASCRRSTTWSSPGSSRCPRNDWNVREGHLTFAVLAFHACVITCLLLIQSRLLW